MKPQDTETYIDTSHPLRQFWLDQSWSNGFPLPESGDHPEEGRLAIEAWNAAIAAIEKMAFWDLGEKCYLNVPADKFEALKYVPQKTT